MIVIVIGMHRSGTSALAGVLHHNGIVMGEEDNLIPKPSDQNVKGFYENYLFRCMNDELIEKSGYVVKSWQAEIPVMKAGLVMRYRMRKLIKHSQKKYAQWGWKDPRTCLTLDVWLTELKRMHLLNESKILYIAREPMAVAYSMVARKNTNFETALALWARYNEYALKAVRSFDVSVLYVGYRKLCEKPVESCRSIFNFLGVPMDEGIVGQFIDPKLNRWPQGSNETYHARVDPALAGRIEKIEKEILN